MKTIEVTVEVRRRLCQEVELTDEEYEAFIHGELDELDIDEIDLAGQFDECRECGSNECWEETDYSICDGATGETIVAWND